MDRRDFIAMAGSVAAAAFSSRAVAQRGGAFLDRAVPGVGLTVSGPVRELRLNFTMDVVTALSDVQVTTFAGAVDSGQQARLRSLQPAGCDHQVQTCTAARHLYSELAYGLVLWAFDLGHIPLHGHLSGRCVVHWHDGNLPRMPPGGNYAFDGVTCARSWRCRNLSLS